MQNSNIPLQNRREFLAFLAASPLLAGAGVSAFTSQVLAQSRRASALPLGEQLGALVNTAEEALDVFDFHAVAKRNLPPAHYGYLSTGVDDDGTLRANIDAFSNYYLRARRLIDVRKIDMSVELFGEKWSSPIIIAPVGSEKAFHEEGDIAVARAAKDRGHLQVLSTVATSSVEEVTAAREAPIWFQLYASSSWELAKYMVKRAEAAGCPALVLTVDLAAPGNRVTKERYIRTDKRDCAVCHDNPGGRRGRKPMYWGFDFSKPSERIALTWDLVRRLQDETSMKLLIKGIMTREDAALCVEHGIDGLIVSNHGGRGGNSGRATIDALPEVLEAVDGRMPVLVDSGIRRGMDIFKALALGANAVLIGRPYLWGLAAFGQLGVDKVLQLLRAELADAMRFAGTPTTGDIRRDRLGIH